LENDKRETIILDGFENIPLPCKRL